MLSKYENFCFLNEKSILETQAYSQRIGETRIGDVLSYIPEARIQLLGICESIGPRVNNGFSGAENGFPAFLEQFSQTQVHDRFDINIVSLLGCITQTNKNTQVSSELVEELDEFVYQVLLQKLRDNQIPIVIGGGHNNALPLIRWANSKKTEFAVVNVDPHADTRNPDSRHSGNSFSFALKEGFLTHYHVLGLHEAYNNSYIRKYLSDRNIFHTFFEDYLFNIRFIDKDVQVISTSLNNIPCGLELDMDCIAYFPSSAISPSGWSLNELRQILYYLAKSIQNISYLHLPESAPMTAADNKLTGKALSYLVRDFISHLKV